MTNVNKSRLEVRYSRMYFFVKRFAYGRISRTGRRYVWPHASGSKIVISPERAREDLQLTNGHLRTEHSCEHRFVCRWRKWLRCREYTR